jgi:WD40 repeat protein
VFGVIWALQRRRRIVALKRLPDTGEPDLVTINPPIADFVDLTPAQLLRIATGMRRARAQSSVSLCLEATVETTARAGGLVTPTFAPRLATSEYLVLVERRGPEDHMHQLMHRWIEQLRGHDVAADCFDFHTDPRVCADAQALRRYRLADLLARYHRAVVLIHAETATLFDEINGQPQPWLQPLLSMTACVLLTPAPTYRWGHRERALIDAGVVVLPATAAGLQIVASMGNEWRQPSDLPTRYARDFPRVITNRDTRWLDRNAPPAEAIAALLQQVSGFLGPTGYQWVCACAVYPQISWATTLALLPDIVVAGDEVGRRRAIDECLPSLARLPWFRAGYMPDWLRSLLIANLPAEREAAVRARLGRLVVDLVSRRDGKARPGTAGTAGAASAASTLEIARSLTPLDIARAAPEGSPLGDRVFIGFLAGANPDPLTLALPAASSSHGPRARGAGEKLIGHWRALTQLRPAMARGIAAGVVGVLSAFALWKVSPTRDVPIPAEAAAVSFLFLANETSRDGIVEAAIAPNGKFMAISHGSGRPGAVLWDVASSKAIATFAANEQVLALAISPDSRLVAAVEASLKVGIWDAAGNAILTESIPNGSFPSASLSFNRDGTLLAVGAGNYASVFDLRQRRFTRTIYSSARKSAVSTQQAQTDEQLRVTALDFGMQPALLAVAFPDHLQFSDVTGPDLGQDLPLSGRSVYALPVAMSADGRYVATVQSPYLRSPENVSILVWERDRPSVSWPSAAKPAPILPSRVPGVFLAWSPRGEVLAYGQSDGRLRIFDPRHANERIEFDSNGLTPLAKNQQALYSIRFSSAAGSASTTYVVERRTLDIETPAPPPKVQEPAPKADEPAPKQDTPAQTQTPRATKNPPRKSAARPPTYETTPAQTTQPTPEQLKQQAAEQFKRQEAERQAAEELKRQTPAQVQQAPAEPARENAPPASDAVPLPAEPVPSDAKPAPPPNEPAPTTQAPRKQAPNSKAPAPSAPQGATAK